MIDAPPVLHLSARIDEQSDGIRTLRTEVALSDPGWGHLLRIDPSLFVAVEMISEADPLVAVDSLEAISENRRARTVAIERAFAELRSALIAEIEADEPWRELRETVNRRAATAKAFLDGAP